MANHNDKILSLIRQAMNLCDSSSQADCKKHLATALRVLNDRIRKKNLSRQYYERSVEEGKKRKEQWEQILKERREQIERLDKLQPPPDKR